MRQKRVGVNRDLLPKLRHASQPASGKSQKIEIGIFLVVRFGQFKNFFFLDGKYENVDVLTNISLRILG